MKTCTKCGETKDFSEFSKGKGYKDGMRGVCRKCTNERVAELKKLKKINNSLILKTLVKTTISIEKNILKKDGNTLCNRCFSVFAIRNTVKNTYCSKCLNEFNNERNKDKEIRDRKRKSDRLYYEKNKDKKKEYRQNNKEKFRGYSKTRYIKKKLEKQGALNDLSTNRQQN